MGVTAVIVAAASVAATGYQIYSGEQQAAEQKKQIAKQENQARAAQQAVEDAEKSKALGAAAKAQRQAQAAQAGYGRKDTILTGPMGLGNDASSPAKSTLLGS